MFPPFLFKNGILISEMLPNKKLPSMTQKTKRKGKSYQLEQGDKS